MQLTAKDHALRRTGVSASEIAGIAGIDPWRSALDVYLTKIAPDAPEPQPETIGHLLEPVILAGYEKVTGLRVQPWTQGTVPKDGTKAPVLLATPDAFVDRSPGEKSHLVECKAVGLRVRSRWDAGVPDYVICQVTWQMGVTGVYACDVAAMLDVTATPAIYSVRFDPSLFDDLLVMAHDFWKCVEDRTPPQLADGEDRGLYLKKRYPFSDGSMVPIAPDHEPSYDGLARRWSQAKEEFKAAHAALESAEADLKEVMGEHTYFRGPWGTFSWKEQPGSIRYKDLALELAGGVLPPELLDRYRSAPSRVFRYSEKK